MDTNEILQKLFYAWFPVKVNGRTRDPIHQAFLSPRHIEKCMGMINSLRNDFRFKIFFEKLTDEKLKEYDIDLHEYVRITSSAPIDFQTILESLRSLQKHKRIASLNPKTVREQMKAEALLADEPFGWLVRNVIKKMASVLRNAMIFNPPTHEVHKMAIDATKLFLDTHLPKLRLKIVVGRALLLCTMCGEEFQDGDIIEKCPHCGFFFKLNCYEKAQCQPQNENKLSLRLCNNCESKRLRAGKKRKPSFRPSGNLRKRTQKQRHLFKKVVNLQEEAEVVLSSLDSLVVQARKCDQSLHEVNEQREKMGNLYETALLRVSLAETRQRQLDTENAALRGYSSGYINSYFDNHSSRYVNENYQMPHYGNQHSTYSYMIDLRSIQPNREIMIPRPTHSRKSFPVLSSPVGSNQQPVPGTRQSASSQLSSSLSQTQSSKSKAPIPHVPRSGPSTSIPSDSTMIGHTPKQPEAVLSALSTGFAVQQQSRDKLETKMSSSTVSTSNSAFSVPPPPPPPPFTSMKSGTSHGTESSTATNSVHTNVPQLFQQTSLEPIVTSTVKANALPLASRASLIHPNVHSNMNSLAHC